MVHILLEGYDIDAPWLKKALSGYILPDMKVAVAALSFRKNRVRSANDWDELYAPGGKFYNGIIAGFKSYGIPAEKVSFIDHFRDTKKSAVEKIGKADILYFLGGMPDLMYERIEGSGLGESMRNFKGIGVVSNSLLLDFSTELWYNDRTNQKSEVLSWKHAK